MQVFEYRPPALPWLDIRYLDRDIIIINKPSGYCPTLVAPP